MRRSYRECLSRLLKVNKMLEKTYGALSLGLDNMQALDRSLEHPSKQFKAVHVTGTNGKGSVSLKIASGLNALGYRTGLSVSPHVSSIRERCQVDDICISEDQASGYLDDIFDACEKDGIAASFFEIVTAMSFLHFANSNVDYAVLEVGLGGRLDATNVIPPPELAVITNVSLDHTRVLGDTVEKICAEKSGIIKPGTRVCIGANVPLEPVQKRCDLVGANLVRVVATGETADDYDEQNKAIAGSALEVLCGREIGNYVEVLSALARMPPCRFQVLKREGVILILDVAHNPSGLEALFNKFRREYPGKLARIVFAMSRLKDSKKCLEIIAAQPNITSVTISSSGEKFIDGKKLLDLLHIATGSRTTKSSRALDPLEAAILEAIAECKESNELLIVCGSIYIMAEARRALAVEQLIDPIVAG